MLDCVKAFAKPCMMHESLTKHGLVVVVPLPRIWRILRYQPYNYIFPQGLPTWRARCS